jgi:hypothetical protein
VSQTIAAIAHDGNGPNGLDLRQARPSLSQNLTLDRLLQRDAAGPGGDEERVTGRQGSTDEVHVVAIYHVSGDLIASFAGLTSIIPQRTARASTCRSACVASKR